MEDHHDDPEPFFLYVAHPAPHKPWTNNSPDFNDPRITGLTPNNRRQVASMMITMDKEIGDLMAKLDDPNGDGNTSDPITDNTLVVFLNDNGGVAGMESGVNGTSNGILNGFKGSAHDGGIRVPMIMAGAGIDPSKIRTVFDKPVHGIDLLPTSVALAGGTIDPSEKIDGVNLIPHLNGTDTALPHETLVHRWRGTFAVIQDNWKLVNTRNTNASPGFYKLHDLNTDPSEANDVSGLSATGNFTYDLDLDLILYHDLHILGDGSTPLQIDGNVSEFNPGQGIKKTGTSNAELNVPRSYSGDTDVLGGNLKIAQINPADESATYRLTTGATLDLTFSGTDTIDTLFIDGIQQPAGVYGATDSGTENETPLITGTRTLTVQSGQGGHTTWSDLYAPGAPFGGDHDNDRIPNGIEYFMGETGASFTSLPVLDPAGTITFPMSNSYSGTYGTNFYLETSPDLEDWDPVFIGDVTITPGTSLSHNVPLDQAKNFIRLAVLAE